MSEGRTAGPGSPVFKVENITKRYPFRKTNALNGVSFQILRGEIVGLLGENGAGKSTIFDVVSGMTRPNTGTILLKDEQDEWRDITRLPFYLRASFGMSYLPQKPSIFANLTTRQNLLGIMELMDQRELRRQMEAYQAGLATPGDFADALLEKFGLTEQRDQKAKSLSGGQKRKLEIVRLFIRRPRLILLDEPYAALDSGGVRTSSEAFDEIRRNGMSILIVDHRVEDILRLSDRVILLDGGVVRFDGEPRGLLAVEGLSYPILDGYAKAFHFRYEEYYAWAMEFRRRLFASGVNLPEPPNAEENALAPEAAVRLEPREGRDIPVHRPQSNIRMDE